MLEHQLHFLAQPRYLCPINFSTNKIYSVYLFRIVILILFAFTSKDFESPKNSTLIFLFSSTNQYQVKAALFR